MGPHASPPAEASRTAGGVLRTAATRVGASAGAATGTGAAGRVRAVGSVGASCRSRRPAVLAGREEAPEPVAGLVTGLGPPAPAGACAAPRCTGTQLGTSGRDALALKPATMPLCGTMMSRHTPLYETARRRHNLLCHSPAPSTSLRLNLTLRCRQGGAGMYWQACDEAHTYVRWPLGMLVFMRAQPAHSTSLQDFRSLSSNSASEIRMLPVSNVVFSSDLAAQGAQMVEPSPLGALSSTPAQCQNMTPLRPRPCCRLSAATSYAWR